MASGQEPDRTLGRIDPVQLRVLQDELVHLKIAFPSAKLRKTVATVPGAPFPISVTASIPAPPSAGHIDFFDQLKVEATVTYAAQGDSQPCIQCRIEITSPELPAALRAAIAKELSDSARPAFPGGVPALAQGFALLKDDFARLLCLLPECIERYEAVDAAGRTVRRMAILSDVASVVIDASAAAAVAAAAATPPPMQKGAHQAAAAPNKRAEGVSGAQGRPHVAPKGSQTAAVHQSLDDEIAAIDRRYSGPAHSSSVVEHMQRLALTDAESSSARHFTVRMTPTDPQWHPPGSILALDCTVSAGYPGSGSFSVRLSDATLQGLSETERSVFNKLLDAEVEGASGSPGALRAVLRQCENRAGDMVHQSADIAAEVSRRRGDGAHARHRKEDNALEVAEEGGFTSPSGPSGSECASDSEGSWSDGDCDDCSSTGTHSPRNGTRPSHSATAGALGSSSIVGLELRLEGLQLVDVDTLDILKLGLQVACSRCHGLGDRLFESTGSVNRHMQSTAACAICHQPWHVEVAPRIVHSGSNVLASVRSVGCVPRDLLPCVLGAQCGQCSGLVAFRNVQPGKANERTCSQCHHRLQVFISEAVFVTRPKPGGGRSAAGASGSGTGAGGPSSGRRRVADDSLVIVPGRPLPENGTCRHYRHSFRWLRFPCCGRRFPCDLCHEEGTDGHEMAWAKRMVCGFCSVEQALAERCGSCGKKVATSASQPSGRATQYWEGGEGQRDPRRLSRNDPHKFRNSKFKTRSRKESRVGEKGKDRTAKKKAAAA